MRIEGGGMEENPIELEKGMEVVPEKHDPNVEILLEKLEHGILDTFDGSSVKLLEKVLVDKTKEPLFGDFQEKARDLFSWLGIHFGAKYAGYKTAFVAAEAGKQIATAEAGSYLSNLLLLQTQEGIVGSLKQGANQNIIEPFIKHALAPLAGKAAEIPLAVAGYLGASALIGGSFGIYQEAKHMSGFGRIAEYIERSQKIIENKKQPDDTSEDPRHALIALHDKMLIDKQQLGHALSRDEWLTFVSAVRDAKADLLREMTKPPVIVVESDVARGLEAQTAAVESIIRNQEGLAECDEGLAAEILSQFREEVASSIEPLEERFKYYNRMSEKAWRYSRAFVQGGFSATGIPLLWRMTKFSARSAHKAARIATLGFIP